MEPRSGQGRAGAMAFALFAGAFRLLAWINGGAALVLVFFMLGVIGSDVAAPDLQRAGAVPGGFPGCLRRPAVRLAGAGQPVAAGRHPAARPTALAGPGAGRAFYVASALCFCAACWLAAGSAATADASVTTGYTGV